MRIKSNRYLAASGAGLFMAIFGLIALNNGSAATLVSLTDATATFSEYSILGTFSVNQTIDGVLTSTYPGWNGWSIDGNTAIGAPPASWQAAVYHTATDASFSGMVYFNLVQDFTHNPSFNGEDLEQLGRFRLSYTTADRSLFANGLDNGGNIGDPSIWHTLAPSIASDYYRDGTQDPGTTFTVLSDGSVLVGGNNHRGSYVIGVPLDASGITGFRIDAVPDPSNPYGGPGRDPWDGNFVLTEFQVSGDPFGAVPEPSTIIAGALLAVPLGFRGLRSLMKRKA